MADESLHYECWGGRSVTGTWVMSHDLQRVIEAAQTVECAEGMDLSECVRRAREGDEEAARELFRGL